MSLQWCIAAGFLYSEIFFVLFLLVPIISPTKWKEIFNSRLIKNLRPKANVFFNFVIVCLIILLLDASRDMIKYSDSQTKSTIGKPKETFVNIEAMKEFRSQRNLYITGISLFLMFVIRRLIVLITTTADLIQDLDYTKRDNVTLKNELSTVLEAKLRLTKMVPEEQSEKSEAQKADLSDKDEKLRSRSKTRVKKEE